MKKYHFLLLCMVAGVFNSCTLMMDEIQPTTTEVVTNDFDFENKGFDEPYTSESEFGTVTYQYADSTRVLKKAVLDYLVKVEDDSVFYFTDNVPSELLIQPGYYASMVATHEIPNGLCSKVLSLTKENGMYKMVTSWTDESKIFKELDVDINVDLLNMSSIEVPDSAECVAMGKDPNNRVVYDFSLLDGKLSKAEVARVRSERAAADFERRMATRSGDIEVEDEIKFKIEEETYKRDAYAEQTMKHSMTIFKLSTADPKKFEAKTSSALYKSLSWLSDNKLTLTFSWLLNTDVTVYYRAEKTLTGKIRREETAIDRSSYVYNLDVGYGDEPLKSKKANELYKKIGDKLQESFKEQLKDEKSWISRLKKSIESKDKSLVYLCPCPFLPGSVCFLRIAPEIQCAFGFVGSTSLIINKAPVMSKVIYEDGERVFEEKPKTDGRTSVNWDFGISGEASFHVGLEALIGVSAVPAGKVLTGIGLGGEIFGQVSVKFGVSKNTGGITDDSNAIFTLALQGKLRAFFLGSSVPVTLGPEFPLFNRTYPLGPSLDEGNEATLNVLTDVDNSKTYEYQGAFKYSSLGLEGNCSPEQFRPHMRIYCSETEVEKKDLKDCRYVDMECLDKISKTESGRMYNFRYTKTYSLAKYCYMVPGYRKLDGSGVDYMNNATEVVLSTEPKMTTLGLYLAEVKPSTVPGKKVQYHIVLKTRKRNVNLIDAQWSEYGAYVYEIYDEEAQRIPSLSNPDEYDILWHPILKAQQKYFPIKADHNTNGIYYYHYYYDTDVIDKTRFVMGSYYISKETGRHIAENEGTKWGKGKVDVYELEVNSESKPNFQQDSKVGGGGTIGRLDSHN